MYQTNLAEKIDFDEQYQFAEEKNLIGKFREAYANENFDEAMKYALNLDAKFYEQGRDLLEV